MDNDSVMKLLGESSVFGRLPGESLKKLCDSCGFIDLGSNVILFEEGDLGSTMYVVLEGQLEVYKQNKRIARRRPFELIGEMAILGSQPRSANIKAVVPSLLLEISKENFNTHIAPHSDVVLEILKTLSERSGVDLNILDRGFRDLHRTQEIYEDIVNSVSDIILRIGPDRKITYANAAVCALGYEPIEMMGRSIEEFVVNEDKQAVLEKLLTKRVDTRATKNLEVWFKVNENFIFSKDIKKLLFLVSSSGVWDVPHKFVKNKESKKKYLGCQLVARDITLRKKMEQELLDYKVYLENQVIERTEELEKSNVELKKSKEEADRANQAKSDFLSRMSHELRTPLNSILGFAQLLEIGFEGSEDNNAKNYTQRILTGGNLLLELVNEVLDLAKIESGKISLTQELVDVNAFFEELFYLMEPLAKKSGIALNIDLIRDSEIYIKADLTRLKQIFLNLISNAIKYNNENGIVNLSVLRTENNAFKFCVEDSGSGIPVDKLETIFQPFERLVGEGAMIEGTGIGLTISKRLTELMGGKLTLESQIGKGSLFMVEFPAASFPQSIDLPNDNQNEPSAERREGSYKILYIEDNPANVELVRQILSRPTIEFMSAPNPKLGIELSKANDLDLILLDITLSEMNGFQVLKILKSQKKTSQVPIIAVSANVFKSDIDKALKEGFDDYVTKPINVKLFLEKINQYLKINPSNEKPSP